MDNTAYVWHLVARVLNGEATADEHQQLIAVLRHDEKLQQQYDLLDRIWKEKETGIDHQDKETAQKTISKIINKAAINNNSNVEHLQRRHFLLRHKVWLAAASFLIIALAGWLWINNRSASNNGEIKQEAIEAKKGSRTRSMLPDGTTVWLNAGSKLSYDDDFTGATRNVRLDGEAFFDVTKQPGRPFIVHTSGIDIKVLGTAFNVKSYPEDKTVETTLYRGSVKVFREKESEESAIQLRPNEKLTLPKEAAIQPEELSSKEGEKLSVKESLPASSTLAHLDSTKKENERIETAWVYNRLEIQGDNFDEMAKKLERWYNVTIIFTDEKVKELSFVGTFENENVEQAFTALKVANNRFSYQIKNHEIFVGCTK
jgi:ferric-dicitrate binding protein FerR (iron transport regulator)